MEHRRVNEEGLALLKQWEALVLYAYDDKDRSNPKKFIEPGMPVQGTLTIGWGHTRRVVPGMRITREEADELFRQDIAPCERAVSEIIDVPLTDNQFAVLVSFAFNLGHATTRGSPLWNIAQTLNTGDYDGAIKRMGLYVNSGGQRMQGLVNRRAAEAGLWARGEFVASASVRPDPPPAAPPPVADAGILGGAAAAATAIAPAITSLGGVPWPVAVAVVAAAFGIAAIWLLRRQRRADTAL